MKIEVSVFLGDRDEEVEIYGKPDEMLLGAQRLNDQRPIINY